MTCIVGYVDNGIVTIGGDSAGIAGLSSSVRADEKVFTNGPFVMGFTGSFRMGQLLRYSLDPPKRRPRQDPYEYMVTTFVDSVRRTLQDGGYAASINGHESGGTFLVGYGGRLYCIEDDYQVAMPTEPYASVGCGSDLALGALSALEQADAAFGSVELEPEDRLAIALEAAAQFSAGVRPPYTFAAKA